MTSRRSCALPAGLDRAFWYRYIASKSKHIGGGSGNGAAAFL